VSNSWFRMYNEFAYDPKVQSMSEELQRRLAMLFCLESDGSLEKLTKDEIAFALRIDDVTLHETLHALQAKGFCDENGRILNWKKRQYVTDSSAERVKRHREKKKKEQEVSSNVTSKKRYSNVTVTPPDTDTDTDTDIKERTTKVVTKEKPKKDYEQFEEFWNLYPFERRCEKPKAFDAWKKAVKKVPPDTLKVKLQSYLDSQEAQNGYAPYPAKWLRNERYNEDFTKGADNAKTNRKPDQDNGINDVADEIIAKRNRAIEEAESNNSHATAVLEHTERVRTKRL